jgi:hydroxymethylpyrimidine/phosphomethylpyrimidine kinase
MVATSGSKLISDGAIEKLVNRLIPIATVITPNVPEAEALCGFEIDSEKAMLDAAKRISSMLTGGVLIKGGRLTSSADDLLYHDNKAVWFKGEKIDNPNTHGTGCTLSSAIACNLALGLSMEESIENAKKYITGALKAGLNLGGGSGPLNHCYNL